MKALNFQQARGSLEAADNFQQARGSLEAAEPVIRAKKIEQGAPLISQLR